MLNRLHVGRLAMVVCLCAVALVTGGCFKDKEKSIELKDFIVNLSDTNAPRYLKLKMKLVVENGDVLAEVGAKDAVIADAIISFLRGKKVVDLQSEMGMKVLKRQLLDLFNEKLLKSGDVTGIYFVNFVIQ